MRPSPHRVGEIRPQHAVQRGERLLQVEHEWSFQVQPQVIGRKLLAVVFRQRGVHRVQRLPIAAVIRHHGRVEHGPLHPVRVGAAVPVLVRVRHAQRHVEIALVAVVQQREVAGLGAHLPRDDARLLRLRFRGLQPVLQQLPGRVIHVHRPRLPQAVQRVGLQAVERGENGARVSGRPLARDLHGRSTQGVHVANAAAAHCDRRTLTRASPLHLQLQWVARAARRRGGGAGNVKVRDALGVDGHRLAARHRRHRGHTPAHRGRVEIGRRDALHDTGRYRRPVALAPQIIHQVLLHLLPGHARVQVIPGALGKAFHPAIHILRGPQGPHRAIFLNDLVRQTWQHRARLVAPRRAATRRLIAVLARLVDPNLGRLNRARFQVDHPLVLVLAVHAPARVLPVVHNLVGPRGVIRLYLPRRPKVQVVHAAAGGQLGIYFAERLSAVLSLLLGVMRGQARRVVTSHCDGIQLHPRRCRDAVPQLNRPLAVLAPQLVAARKVIAPHLVNHVAARFRRQPLHTAKGFGLVPRRLPQFLQALAGLAPAFGHARLHVREGVKA